MALGIVGCHATAHYEAAINFRSNNLENFKQVFNVLKNFEEEEFQIIALRGIKMSSTKIIMTALEKMPEFREWAKKIIHYL